MMRRKICLGYIFAVRRSLPRQTIFACSIINSKTEKLVIGLNYFLL
jgi:hypothetical protein